MKTKDLTARFAVIQFCFWTCFAGIVAFSSFYLLGKGMTNTQIGIIIAVSGTIAALLQPVTGIVMDRFPVVTSPSLLAVFFSLLIVDTLVLIFAPELSLTVTGILYGFMIMTVQLTQSLLNVVGVDSMSRGNRLNFNLARAVGSAGYAIAAWGIGALSVRFPPVLIPVTVAVSAVIVTLFSGTYPIRNRQTEVQNNKVSGAKGPIEFLRSYPMFFLLLPALTMIYFSHAVLNTFTLQIMNALGGGSAEMGTATAIAAAGEVITVTGFAVLRKHLDIRTLLRISGSSFAVKSVLSALVITVTGFYSAQICQMTAWGIMCVAIVYYVNETVPEADRAKGQTYAGMTLTAANVLGAVIGGRITDTAGVRTLLILGVVVCACGALLLFPATRREHRKIIQ